MDRRAVLARNARTLSKSFQTALSPVAAGPAVASGVLVDVVVLSGDMTLFESAKEAVGERNPVWRARSAEEAADLLLTARCGVLLVDMSAVSSRADSFVMQIVEQFPDVVICVAGSREDEPLLVQLISDGLVYRFMHKPLTARRAGMFLQAAIRHHLERRDTLQVRDPLLPTQRRSARRPAMLQWILGGTLLAALVVVAGYQLPRHSNSGLNATLSAVASVRAAVAATSLALPTTKVSKR